MNTGSLRLFILTMLFAVIGTTAFSQAAFHKMSPLVRNAALSAKQDFRTGGKMSATSDRRSICAFVKVDRDADRTLSCADCRVLASYGDIYIADIPLDKLSQLSVNPNVKRIEAGTRSAVCLDTTAVVVDAASAFVGTGLPQAYDGSGVVMGVMDVGFDLTHPNFLSADMTDLRIRRFWDQLSPDSLGSTLYVGADYRTPEDILAYAHSLDASIESHGTHTLGIAAGTGFDTPYRGMAPGADICIVSNAVNTDVPLIPEELLYKYTTATDALGFKYIFDYADEVGKPCVISFSEGSREGLDGEQQLYYEVLSRMTGPGRILVASAGNEGYYNTYLRKPRGREIDGAFFYSTDSQGSLTLLSDDKFKLTLAFHTSDTPSMAGKTIETEKILAGEDSILVDSIETENEKCVFRIHAYRSSLPSGMLAYDVEVAVPGGVGYPIPLSIALSGVDADVEAFSNGVTFYHSSMDEGLSGGERKCCVLSPGSAPSVICVGGTAHRDTYMNLYGECVTEPWGHEGLVGTYSSVGPTRYGFIKPDVVAPGTCVRSSYSSYYIEENNNSGVKMSGLMSLSEYNGRSYGWGSMSGTSMSAPVVGGAIALWLQANPFLSPTDILEIFSSTCNRSRFDTQGDKNCSCGFGEIDVYAGLIKALSLDGVEEISDFHPLAVDFSYHGYGMAEFTLRGGVYDTEDVRLNVYSSDGRLQRMLTPHFDSGRCLLSLADMPHGVYVLQMLSSNPALRGSFVVRR